MSEMKGVNAAVAPVTASGVSADDKRAFAALTHPDDSYTTDGVYWADLPLGQRVRFVTSVDAAEAAAELRSLGQMIKKDPLSPFSWYFDNAILPGAGLGLEGYVLFSIGNLAPLFKAVWPYCWGHSQPGVCSQNWIAAVTYLEIVGIMVGQMLVGVMGDWIGRRFGLIQDAVIMFIGLVMLTASWGLTLQGWVICYALCLMFYGIGVGGEYPVTATAAMENALAAGTMSTREDRLHRGRRVTMAFLMQGWGQFFNQLTLIVCLLIFNRHAGNPGNPPYSEMAAQVTFRLSFALPAIGTLWLVYYRIWKMPDASKQLELAKKKAKVTGYDLNALRFTFSHFGGRILATAGTWFANDVFFYGNKLFQGAFIKVISSNPDSLLTQWWWSLINVAVSMVGYYLATFLIDNKLYGRKNMQQVGFFMCFLMFIIPAYNFEYYKRPENIHWFQVMYFLSSFFNQFGPNSVTFLVAGEVFPTQIRASAHGFSACLGKAGALLASVLYNYIDDQTKFYFVPWFGLAGMVLTWLFLPDTTGLDLQEQERRWGHILKGEEKNYHGIAVHKQHLSMWERFRGVGNSYNPQLDHEEKINEYKAEWIAAEQERATTEDGSCSNDTCFSPEINNYMQRTYNISRSGDSIDEKKVAL
ncbi:putative inorganic phosphate transporter C23D3.12 [Ceratocystis fimbriata CBS 114723]|uniref:Putative inorganic phosphate transporter C23D3.12 n=1 Tax=Ceratocystis fimbriata CBS 114723 TaxID=1035309 RepID=A0A2C5XA26_9PEZI|nr:putative inorganic phosphate transporter C23D3.12 [Ceratocystis fimbriata CBS 114723]